MSTYKLVSAKMEVSSAKAVLQSADPEACIS
jgi:hypothetical protein